jgi:hypothetical protein
MKKIKINLSKTSWIILSAGVFIVVLAGLGVTFSQQMKKSSQLDEELEVTEMRLEKYNIDELQQQENELIAILAASSAQYDTGKTQLQQNIESIEVTDKCYLIASLSNVIVRDIGTTEIKESAFSGINCDKITVSVSVRGELPDMVNFINNLNQSFTTGYIDTAQIMLGETQYASVQLVVYSYRGE